MGNVYGTTKIIWDDEKLDHFVRINSNAKPFFKSTFHQNSLPYKIYIKGDYAGINECDYIIMVKFRRPYKHSEFTTRIVLHDDNIKKPNKKFHCLATLIKNNPNTILWNNQMLHLALEE